MSALASARSALVGYGTDLAQICDELGLCSVSLSTSVDDADVRVHFVGMVDDRPVMSFTVVTPKQMTKEAING